jgi:hypothetical protein
MAKKNGVLGRDAVVRKTMLDDCKGERLEEVLAVFSSAVLKKVVAEQGYYPAIAQRLALEHRGYSGERPEVGLLGLAHRVSLSRLLMEKKSAQRQFHDFAELLDLKERTIARRQEQVRARAEQEDQKNVPDDLKFDVWRTVRNNWSGNERWMEGLLYGDSSSRRDGLLSASFDKVWRKAQSGRLSEVDDRDRGLLEQLEGRVRLQQERLGKWKDFYSQRFGDSVNQRPVTTPEPKNRTNGIDLEFGAHESIHIGRMSPRKLPSRRPPKLNSEYASLVDTFQQELSTLENRKPLDFGAILPQMPSRTHNGHTSLAVDQTTEEVISELSDLDDITDEVLVVQESAAAETGRRVPEGDRDRSRSVIRDMSSTKTRETPKASPTRPASKNDVSPSRASARHIQLSPQREYRNLHSSRSRSPAKAAIAPPSPTMAPLAEEPAPKSPTQLLADQILESMDNASPSPTKKSRPRHTLSLAERTRLSMARTSHAKYYPADEDGDEEDAETLPLKPAVGNSAVMPIVTETNDDDEYEDLVTRTRKSMAGFEAAKQKAQLERRRSQRKSKMVGRREGSYFPKVDEETQVDASFLTEELIGQEDCEAVFKSRPRIKTSPAPSPTKRWDEDEDI